MMKLRLFARTAALSLALAFGSSSAIAQDKAQDKQDKPTEAKVEEAAVSAEVVILHATNDGSGIDPKIGKMPELGKPPFSSYNSYKLLDRVKLSLAKGKSSTQKLPNDRVLQVTLKDISAGKKKDEPKKYVVSASIQKPGGNVFLPLLEVNAKAGETFFVAGQTHKGGVLVIGIKVAP
jgi:hypothetical protein